MRNIIYLLCTGLLSIAARCNKEDAVLQNLCEGSVPFSASFTIEEKIGDTSYVTDKMLAPGYVLLKARGEYDSVRWYVDGSQNTSTSRNYTLYFDQPEPDVDVMMIGYKKNTRNCFPGEKTVDTLRRVFSVLPRNGQAAIVGRFLGANTANPTDTFTVTITADNSAGIWQYFVRNLPKNCPGYTVVDEAYPREIGLSVSSGYGAFRINANSRVCAMVNGFGSLKNNDSLIISYTAVPMSPAPYAYGERGQYLFKGVRQP